MKRCTKCSIDYSELWNICLLCKLPLAKDNLITKVFSKPRSGANYIFPILEKTIDQSDVIFLYLDKDLKPMMCNRAIESITGYRREEIFKNNWLNLFFRSNPSRREIFKAVLNSCLNSIKSRAYEGSIIKKDGTECILSWRNTTVTDASGNIWGILCIAEDMTEYKDSVDNVTTCSERLRDIFANVKEYAVLTANLDHKITYYGIGAKELFKWQEDMTLKDISMLFVDSPEENLKEAIKKSVRSNNRFEQEAILKRANGGVFPAILTVNVLFDNDNRRSGYVYIIRDNSEEKRMAKQMVQNEKLAAMGQLSAGVAHEINNPLLVILGRLDMLAMEDEKLSPETERTLETIKNQAQRMRVIIDRLLLYSRKKAPQMEVLNINEVLKTIAPLVAYHPEFKKITWKEDLQEDTAEIKGEFNQLQEVFLNLALNACHAMPEGGALSISSSNTKDGYVEISVTDTGMGISKENINKLFVPFFTTKDNGTGLGLAICHTIIQSHHGTIGVESNLGKGTVFRVKLPINKKE
ncbi:MAG: PAS domain-containing protein [Candidatus Omnitrophica bacterium]|nr:PAS domain-containing protein [Candidatus Omnitrophota bacterium]